MKTQEERLRAAMYALAAVKQELGFSTEDDTATQMVYDAIEFAHNLARSAWHPHYKARRAIEEAEAVPA